MTDSTRETLLATLGNMEAIVTDIRNRLQDSTGDVCLAAIRSLSEAQELGRLITILAASSCWRQKMAGIAGPDQQPGSVAELADLSSFILSALCPACQQEIGRVSAAKEQATHELL